MIGCDVAKCSGWATHHKAFRVWPGNVREKKLETAVLDGWLPVALCHNCAVTISGWRMLTPAYWQQIVDRVTELGFAAPTMGTIIFYVAEGRPELVLDPPAPAKAEGA